MFELFLRGRRFDVVNREFSYFKTPPEEAALRRPEFRCSVSGQFNNGHIGVSEEEEDGGG